MIEPQTPLADVGERALVRYLRDRIPRGPGVIEGLGDDAAALESLGPFTLVTVDSLVEGTHFRRVWSPPQLLGRKALATGLSDVAAMGGTPRHAIVSLCLPPDTPFGFVDGLYDGLLERAAESAVNIVGGNIAAGAAIVIDVTLLGQVEHLLRRSGAEPGDRLMVSGTLGASAVGLMLLQEGARLDPEGRLASPADLTPEAEAAVMHCLKAHLDPSPPIALGRSMAERELAHAAIDVSDGLSGDLRHLCVESGLAAWVDAEKLPVDPAAAAVARERQRDVLDFALHGGEDYQLLFAVPPDRVSEAKEIALVWNLPLAEIGQFEAGEPGVSLRTAAGFFPMAVLPYDHFRGRGAA